MKSLLLLASAMAIGMGPALALQATVTKIDKNPDGTMTYHFTVKLDQGEDLSPGDAKVKPDFVTIYNFYGLVDGSAKSPAPGSFRRKILGAHRRSTVIPWSCRSTCRTHRTSP